MSSRTMLWLMLLAASMATNPLALKSPAIGVFIDFDATPNARSVDVMKEEAGKIMQSAGFRLDWRALSQNQGKEAFSHVVVVKFHGKCKLEYPFLEMRPDETVTMASTEVQDGHVLPFSNVQCDEVRRILASGAPPDRQKALGLALGRVVAHELYHLLADTGKHTSAGLAKATHDVVDLVTGTPKLAFR